MKTLAIILLTFLTPPTFANISGEIVADITETINYEFSGASGAVTSMKCINHFVGILCYGSLEFSEEETYTCEETYYYLGFGQMTYKRLCSNCWFNEDDADIFKPSCH